jgi:hypothetical protein
MPESPEPASALDRVARSAEVLENVPDDALRNTTAEALLELAQAIEPRSRKEATNIRECARRLERAEPRATPGAIDFAAVREGLMATWRALEQGTTSSSRPQEYERALATLRSTTEALSGDADVSAHERRASAASAFRAASDALALALDGEPVFAESENAVQDSAPELSLEARLEQARAEVLKLGQTRWVNAPLAASQALEALADLVAVNADRRLEKPIGVIRFNAELLRQKTSKFGSAGWIKVALASTLEALDVLEAGREKLVSPWTRSARRAVAGIEERDSLSFQRAAVQDAFRATVDAFLFSIQARKAADTDS